MFISIEIPEYCDKEAATDVASKAIQEKIQEEDRLRFYKKLWLGALESDEGFQAWKDKMDPVSPVVRASTYEEIMPEQEIPSPMWGVGWGGDPRRPVNMKGSHLVQSRKHRRSSSQCDNGYCYKVYKRYIRMKKTTCLDGDEIREFKCNLPSVNTFKVHKYTSYHLEKDLWGYLCHKDAYHPKFDRDYTGEFECWVNGKRVYLKIDQIKYLKKLREIVGKFDSIESRFNALKKWRAENAA